MVLSRERLLTISSIEYEAFLAGITRSLTSEETAEVRRQRRLIKNRESAALSRNRKKQAMEVLEEENAALRRELAKAKAKLEQYERVSVMNNCDEYVLYLWGVRVCVQCISVFFGIFLLLCIFQRVSKEAFLYSIDLFSCIASCVVCCDCVRTVYCVLRTVYFALCGCVTM